MKLTRYHEKTKFSDVEKIISLSRENGGNKMYDYMAV